MELGKKSTQNIIMLLKTLHYTTTTKTTTVVFLRAGKDQDHLRVEMKLGHHHFEMHFHPVDAQRSIFIILPSFLLGSTRLDPT